MDVREYLAFLHGATVRIGSSLESGQAVAALCQTAVPHLADVAVTYLKPPLSEAEISSVLALDESMLRQVALADRLDGGHGLVDKVAMADLGGPFAETMSTGQPVLAETDEDVTSVLPFGWAGSLLVVPLRVKERVLGFTALLRLDGREAFDDTDMLTVTLMTDQAALTVYNGHLYQREARIADMLQRSMLPPHPPTLPGMEIAYRYLPSSPSVQVGGDWFDAIPLSGGRVAFVVGDVMGHGVRSATAMGQLRTAVRTLAALDPPPDQVLRHLDDMLNDASRHLDQQHLATCIYCVYDPVARRLSIANAGHIPPVLVYPDGRTELMRLPSGGPVGLGGVAFETVEVGAPDGGVLVLCTDGLVESRHRDLSDGLAALRVSLAGCDRSLDDLCEGVLEALGTEDREDDVALLAARFLGIPSENVAQWILRPHPLTPSRARRLIRTTLTDWGLSQHADVTELLATELITNAIRFASRPIGIRLMRTDGLLCEVTDDDHHLPVLREPSDTQEDGRGLFLVSHLAERWGTSRTSSGKAVWFELS